MISVTLNCRLTRDPETRYTPSGTAVCSLGLADSNTRKAPDGSKIEEAVFIDCDFFGKRAESIGQYFTKGSGICITGKLVMDTWQDKNTGEKRSKLKIVGNDWSFPVAEPRNGGGHQPQQAPQGQQPNYGGYQQPPQQPQQAAPQYAQQAPPPQRQAPPPQFQQPAPPPQQRQPAPAPQQFTQQPPPQQAGFQNFAPQTRWTQEEDDVPF